MVSEPQFCSRSSSSMANSSSSLLTLANNNTSNLSLQLPPITIKLDRDNYSLWRSTIISALETFELESFILSPTPPRKTHITTTSDGVSIPEPNPDFLLWKKKITLFSFGSNPHCPIGLSSSWSVHHLLTWHGLPLIKPFKPKPELVVWL